MKVSEELSGREGYVENTTSLFMAARTAIKNREYVAALDFARRALGVSGQLIGLAFRTEREKRFEESMGCFADALNIREAVKKDLKAIRIFSPESAAELGKLTADMAKGYCMIAYSKALGSIGNPDQSIALADAKLWAKKSLDERVALYGIKHDEVANGLELLGAIYHLSGNFTKGLSCLSEATKIRSDLPPDPERVCQANPPSVRFQKFSHEQALSVIGGIAPERLEECAAPLGEMFSREENVSPFKFLRFLQEQGLELPRTNILEKRESALEDSKVGRGFRATREAAKASFVEREAGRAAAASADEPGHLRA